MSIMPSLSDVFTRRTCLLANLVKGVLAAPPLERFSPGWVTHFTGGIHPSSGYKALEKGIVDDSAYLKYAATLSDSDEDIVIFDVTNIPKEKSATSPSRQKIVTRAGFRSFRSHTVWAALTGVMIPAGAEDASSWVLPLVCDIPVLREDQSATVVRRVLQIRALRSNGFTLLLDAGFDVHAITLGIQTAGIEDVSVLARRSKVAAFWRVGDTTKYSKEHIKASRDDGDFYDQKEHPYYGKVTINAWEDVTQKRKDNAQGMGLHVSCTKLGKRHAKIEMVLFMTGPLPKDLFSVLYLYMKRFAIEHFFRFLKQHWGLTDYACQYAQTLKNWIYVLFSAFLTLRHLQGDKSLLPYWLANQESQTPFKAWMILTPASLDSLFLKYNVSSQKGGLGWQKGRKRAKRKRHPVSTVRSRQRALERANSPKPLLQWGRVETVEGNPRRHE